MNYHNPVLLQPACNYLEVKPNCLYIDATYGGGGHSTEILTRGGRVLAIDQDQDALDRAPHTENLILKKANFAYLPDLLADLKLGPISGLLVDLGVSSHQLNTADRGFSFQLEGPLDMRMDRDLQNSAATLVNTLPEAALAQLLTMFGELPNAKPLAKKIITHRPITTTMQLKNLCSPFESRRLFQALRIAVNDELGALASLLESVHKILAPGGRFVAISFHSLEDRAIKTSISEWEKLGLGKNLTATPITPDETELQLNPRSHSAKLRAYQKI